MSEPLEPLSAELAALLGKLPQGAPETARKAAVWQRLASSSAALEAVTGATAGAAVGAGTAASAAGGTLAAKIVAPLVAVAMVTGIGAGVALDRTVLAPEPKIVVKTERVEVPMRVEVPVPAPPVEEPPKPAPGPKARPLVSSEERQLIEAARTALIKRNAVGAIEALELHRSSYAKGQLAEERDALEVQALAQLGRLDDARAAARRFTSAYPRSVFGSAVEAATK